MKNIIESSYIYALLIFLGFYNYYCFYNCFDINIATYLTSGELLLSFLPLTIPVIGIMILLAMLYVKAIIDLSFENKLDDNTTDKYRIPRLYVLGYSYRKIKDLFKDKKWKSINSYYSLLIYVVSMLIGVAFILFFIGYIFYFMLCLEGKYVSSTAGNLFFMGIVWFLIFDELIETVIKGKNEIKKISHYFFLLIFLIALIKVSKVNDAKEILNGTCKERVIFEYNNAIVKSDSNFVLVGKTERYIFLRNLNEGKNYIYPTERIGLIKTERIKK